MKRLLLVAMVGLAVSPALAMTDAEALAAAKEAVRAQLKDPYSAIFSGVSVRKRVKTSMWICGVVNEKNSYGGYTGPHLFTYDTLSGITLIEDGDHDAMADSCRG